MAEAQEALDHRLLNEVDGLEAPTLERIAMWLWNRLQNRVPGLAEIEIARDSCREGAIYSGPAPSRHRCGVSHGQERTPPSRILGQATKLPQSPRRGDARARAEPAP